MAAKKRKRLTVAEKKSNREIKQTMIADGILPPPKKPLNRKKFCKEVHAEWKNSKCDFYRIVDAMPWLMPSENTALPITAEQVGILKLIKLSIALDRFWKQKEADSETKATYGEIYDAVVKPILDL